MADLMLESISLIAQILLLLFMAILPFVIFFLAAAALAAVIYSWLKKTTFQKAFLFAIKTMWSVFFEKEEVYFYPDIALGTVLSKALIPYNKLPLEYVNPICGNYPNTKIPAIQLKVISKTWDEDEPVVCDILEEIFEEEVIKRNFNPFRIFVMGELCKKNKYFIYILYAIKDEEIKAFDEYKEKLQKYQEEKALKETEQIIDEELEADLKERTQNG